MNLNVLSGMRGIAAIRRRSLWLATRWIPVVALGLIAVAAFSHPTAAAATPPAPDLDQSPAGIYCENLRPVLDSNSFHNPGADPTGANGLSNFPRPDESGPTWFPTRLASHEVPVWATLMRVGKAVDGTGTYMGFMPGAAPTHTDGILYHPEFSYQGVDFNVLGLFHQQVVDGVHKLVFSSNRKLPKQLALLAGPDIYQVSESAMSGDDSIMYVWELDASPGWAEGQCIPVGLFEPTEPPSPPGPL